MRDQQLRNGAPATLRDVAEVAQVHPGTASRALNPRTRRLVNDETAERVIAAADALGYQPNPIARGLKTNRSFAVGVLIPDLTNPIFPPIVRGIQDTLERVGYTPLIANTDNDAERERTDLATLRARQVDGIIAATASDAHGTLAQLVEANVPVSLVNRGLTDHSLPVARVDDHAGVRAAVFHLAGLGHRRIAYLGGPETLSTGRNRRDGFTAAMEEVRFELDPELLLFGEITEAEGARLCARALASRERPTAIVAANDLMALGCYDALAEHGLACPQDVSVVGFNDMPFADRFAPPLTTVRIPHYDLGRYAAELLLERIEQPDVPPREVILPPELIVRGSTAPPRTQPSSD